MTPQTQIYLEGNLGTGWQFAGSCKTVDEAQDALKLRQEKYPQCEWRIVYPTESARTPQTQFTPGPWRFEIPDSRKDFDEGFRWIHAADDTVVAKVRLIESDWGESKANARLIASAPEMYSALESLVEAAETVCDCGECRGCLITAIGREVLNKAMGTPR